MKKDIFLAIFIFLFGILGAVFAEIFILPYLLENFNLENFWAGSVLNQREVRVFPKEEIVIQENVALTKAIEKVEKTVLGVSTKTNSGKTLQGSGLILTSDGLIITLADLVPQGSVFSFYVDGRPVGYEIFKRDHNTNLALVKIKNGSEHLVTVGFADLTKIKKGQRIFLVANVFNNNRMEKIVDEGIITYFDQNFIKTNIAGQANFSGSVLFDIEANILGINFIDSQEKIITIPINIIRQFAGL